jgi:molybdopterin/thiamine biosynthesis adenylyltransferase
METEKLLSILEQYDLKSSGAYQQQAFSRNIGLLNQDDQERLSQARVAIPGMGGVGGVHLITLVRSGVGKFHLADYDVFEPVNVNRQYGARIPDFGKPKLEAMMREALRINPFVEIRMFSDGLSPENMDDFLNGVDVVLDGLDFFNFDVRRLLFNRAREKGVYVITAAPLGFSSAMLIFSPHEGMSFDEYFHVYEDMPDEEKYLAFGMGLAPRGTHIKYMDLSKVDLESKGGPSLNIACQLCSAMAATEAVRILLNRKGLKPVPYYHQFDPYAQKYRQGYLFMGNRNPVQRMKMAYVKRFLLKKPNGALPRIPDPPVTDIPSEGIPEDAVHYILRAGIQGPSGDNAQPWKFSWDGNNISVHLHPESDLSFFNVRQIASTISCGAVLENMRIASTAFGLESDVSYTGRREDPHLMASMELRYTGRDKDPLHQEIWKRCTNRKIYDRKPIPQKVFESLFSQIPAQSGVALHLLSERADLKSLAKIIYKVDRIRTEHRPLHEHLVSMIRFDDKEALEKRDGFPLKNLEAGMAGDMFLKLTRPWQVMNVMNRVGLGRMVALHSSQAILGSSCAALLTVPGMEKEDFLRGGQALERIWLTLTQHGISVQPMTAITLFWLRWQLEGPESFMDKHQHLLNSVWGEYQGLFPGVDFSKEGHVMLFRMGYAKEIKHRTYRKELDSFLILAPDDKDSRVQGFEDSRAKN